MKHLILRDGKTVAGPFDTESEAFGALLRLQPMSTDWAMKYEGYAIVPEYGTVERQPYVGDSDIIVVTCRHGDYSRIFKGAGQRGGPVNVAVENQAHKALWAHFAAKHEGPDDLETYREIPTLDPEDT